MIMKSKLIVIEGVDSSGKATQSKILYDKLAEIIDKYVFPGSRLNVEAKLKIAPRTTKSGDKIEEIQIVANNVEFISTPRKKDGTTEGDTASPVDAGPASVAEEVPDETPAASAAPSSGFGMFIPNDDDVPF